MKFNGAATKILLVAAANSVTGGGERHVVDLLQGLVSARNYEVAVAAPEGGDLQKFATVLDVDYFPCTFTGAPMGKNIDALGQAIYDLSPDIVHAHGARAATFARMVDPQAAERTIYTIHGIHTDKGLGRFVKAPLERRLKTSTAHFITVCESDKAKGAHLSILDVDKTSVIYNGVEAVPASARKDGHDAVRKKLIQEIAEMQPGATPDDDALLLLHVGRAAIPKDQKTLIEAFAHYRQSCSKVDVCLLMVVSPDDTAKLYPELLRAAETHGIADHVHFLEPRPDLSQLYMAADAFVLSSLWEGFPYVIIEAANWGLPIISTDVDGIKEAVNSPEEGILVPAGDVEELATALTTFVQMPCEQRKSMGEAAKAHINRDFTLTSMIEKTIEVYDEVLRSKNSD